MSSETPVSTNYYCRGGQHCSVSRRQPLICIHVELQCSLGSGTVGIGVGVATTAMEFAESSESPITALELLEEFPDDLNQLENSQAGKT